MILTCRVALKPTKDQEKFFWDCANAARFIYNFSLGYRIQTLKDKGIYLKWNEIVKHITWIKHKDKKYKWLLKIPTETIKYAVKDMDSAYKKYSKGVGKPKFKKKYKVVPAFYTRYDTLHSTKDKMHITISGLKDDPIETSEECIIPDKPLNPRIKYDGRYWYLTYGVELSDEAIEVPVIKRGLNRYFNDIKSKQPTPPLGIDLGIIHTAVCSDGKVYENINKTDRMQKLEVKKKKLQRKLARKYEEYKKRNEKLKATKEGINQAVNQVKKKKRKEYKRKSIKKLEKKLRLVQRRMNNIRHTFINQMTIEIVKSKPSRIVIEDLDISEMVRQNKRFAKHIYEQCLYEIRRQLVYKGTIYNIPVKIDNRYYPSSKTCSTLGCNYINHNLTVTDRLFICPVCKSIIDRDLNAAINLSRR